MWDLPRDCQRQITGGLVSCCLRCFTEQGQLAFIRFRGEMHSLMYYIQIVRQLFVSVGTCLINRFQTSITLNFQRMLKITNFAQHTCNYILVLLSKQLSDFWSISQHFEFIFLFMGCVTCCSLKINISLHLLSKILLEFSFTKNRSIGLKCAHMISRGFFSSP